MHSNWHEGAPGNYRDERDHANRICFASFDKQEPSSTWTDVLPGADRLPGYVIEFDAFESPKTREFTRQDPYGVLYVRKVNDPKGFRLIGEGREIVRVAGAGT